MVYTNLSSQVRIKSLLNIETGSFMDTNSVSDEYNIESHMLSFKDSGFDKKVTNERIFGDFTITSIVPATSADISVQLVLDNELIGTDTIQTIITNLTDLQPITVGSETVYNYSETDTKRRHRIALLWSDGNDTYMKVYYNAYVKGASLIKDDEVSMELQFSVPAMDIETGSGNYYEYEGSAPTTVLSNIDTNMKWA